MTVSDWPLWATGVAWTVVTLAAGWAIACALSAVVASWLAERLRGRRHRSVQPALQVVRRRLSWWCALIGTWVAAGYWLLTPEAGLFVSPTVFVLGAASVTLAAAAVVTQIVDRHGALIAPALPVTPAHIFRLERCG